MTEKFNFDFKVVKVVQLEDEWNSKEVHVHVKIKKDRNEFCLESVFPVRITEAGIFPVPKAIAAKVNSPILRRLLPFELKRYIKPQKRFLEPGIYEKPPL